jgi:hypothetical protein
MLLVVGVRPLVCVYVTQTAKGGFADGLNEFGFMVVTRGEEGQRCFGCFVTT